MSHTLVITAEDAGTPTSLSTNATLKINITAVNEFDPVFSGPSYKALTLEEDIAIGTVVYQVAATDDDCCTDGEVEYYISSGDSAGQFQVDAVSGNISIADSLDRETKALYDLVVMARDKSSTGVRTGGPVNVQVSVKDINDNAPVFDAGDRQRTVNESATVGHQAIVVKATDADTGTNAELVYSISSGNSLGLFAIEQNLGTISVDKSLDLESGQLGLVYDMVVSVTDKGSPPQQAQINVTIELTPVNEFAPVLSHADRESVQMLEDAAVGARVFDVNATDQDYGEDGRLSYSITNGDSLGQFSINSSSG